MSINYYSNKVQETTSYAGTGNLILDGAPLGYRTFLSAIGADNRFNYYIYRQDTDFEWEIGTGYLMVSGGLNILVREKVISSSSNNAFVNFTRGTKYVETIITSERTNSAFLNLVEKSGNFSAPAVSATYIVNADPSGITVSLPEITSASTPIIMGFMLNQTSGNQYEQNNAVLLVPNGSQTINGSGSIQISYLKDYLQIAAIPSQSGWVTLDPILESAYPYGSDGNIQFKYNSAFSGVSQFNWDSSNSSLLIGGTGDLNTASVIFPSYPTSTVVFNEQSYANDFRVEGSGSTHLFFIDGGSNTVGINTSSATDILTINASGNNGLTIYKSGVGPNILLLNTSLSGITTNNIVGSIIFSGLNTNNNYVNYGRIYTVIDSSVDNNEKASLHIETINAGSNEDVAVFSTSGLILGFNNQNTDGIVIGSASNNEGDNVIIGNFHDVCGEGCVAIGNTLILSSGTYGGLIGTNHSASGNNIWIMGGSGVSITGDAQTYLALSDDTHLGLISSGSIVYSTLSDNDINFVINNSSALTTGIFENIQFKFNNSSAIEKTGLVISNKINNVTNNSEHSTYSVKTVSSGSLVEILNLSDTNLVIGYNNYSGNNIIHGYGNTVLNSGNSVFGRYISASGNNNTVIGQSISCSGSSNTIIGKDNTCLTNGNLGIVMIGSNNEADEDYSISIGIDNANSGLYSVACGYLNGVHGDYSIGIGESNTITSNGSVAFGRSNNLSSTNISATLFALGVGNLGSISNTGVIFGYNNQMYGGGAFLIGTDLYSTGNNNVIIGKNSVASGNNNILIGNTGSISGNNNIKIYRDDNNYINFNETGVLVKNTGLLEISNNILVKNSGFFNSGIVVSGRADFPSSVHFSSGIIRISNLTTPTGANYIASTMSSSETGVFKLLYQQGPGQEPTQTVRHERLAFSGSFVTPLYLTANSPEHQFLYPTGVSSVYLPNGTGLYLGKTLIIANMGNYAISVFKTGVGTATAVLNPGRNISVTHAGNNNWIKLAVSIN